MLICSRMRDVVKHRTVLEMLEYRYSHSSRAFAVLTALSNRNQHDDDNASDMTAQVVWINMMVVTAW